MAIEGPTASQEPEPTEAGPETMAKRAAELKRKALEGKAGREKALKAETERLAEAEKAEADSNEKTAVRVEAPGPRSRWRDRCGRRERSVFELR